MKLLDLSFQILLELVTLCGIVSDTDLLVDTFERLDTLRDFLEGLVDLLLRLAGRHRCCLLLMRTAVPRDKIPLLSLEWRSGIVSETDGLKAESEERKICVARQLCTAKVSVVTVIKSLR